MMRRKEETKKAKGACADVLFDRGLVRFAASMVLEKLQK